MAASMESGPQFINILLLGETGVGKSTLINAFANYSAFHSYEDALKGEQICLIPTKFSFTDEDLNSFKVTTGPPDPNENMEEGQSGTLSCKSYVFALSETLNLRWIDTSGFGDTQGSKKDVENLEDILDYVVQYKVIHAIAIVANVNQTRPSTQLEDYLTQIFKRLGRDALEKTIFIFTHGLRPQNGLPIMRSLSSGIQNKLEWQKEIKLNKQNIFCFENKPFRELQEIKSEVRNDPFTNLEEIESNWSYSTKEFQRLIDSILFIKPHDVSKPFTKHEFNVYTRSLCVISGIILSNIENNRNQLLKSQVITRIQVEPRGKAITMCLSVEDCTYTKDKPKAEFECYGRNICCKGCKVPLGRRSCNSINFITAKCINCKCNFKKHELIYYQVSAKPESLDRSKEEYIRQLNEEEDVIKNGLLKLVNNINNHDKKISDNNYSLDDLEQSAFRIDKFLYALTWKGSPREICAEVKRELEDLEIYGKIIKEVCQINANSYSNLNKLRDVFVKSSNKVFKVGK